jgi:hypothetical protein
VRSTASQKNLTGEESGKEERQSPTNHRLAENDGGKGEKATLDQIVPMQKGREAKTRKTRKKRGEGEMKDDDGDGDA